MLRNDQLALTEELDKLLQQYFSQKPKTDTAAAGFPSNRREGSSASTPPSREPSASFSLPPPDQKRPFAIGKQKHQPLTEFLSLLVASFIIAPSWHWSWNECSDFCCQWVARKPGGLKTWWQDHIFWRGQQRHRLNCKAYPGMIHNTLFLAWGSLCM